jgi:type I restriction enzyme S subunit
MGGDIVITIRGGIGDVAIVPDELTGANLTQDVARVAPQKGVSSEWLFYALQAPRTQHDIRRRVTGATITGLNIWELDRIQLPLVSADRQRRDAEQLAEEAKQLQLMRQSLDRQLSLLRERRKALITAAVSGQLDVPEIA